MALSFLYLRHLPLRRTIGAAVFFALYSGLIPFSEANEHLYLEYLVFTHQKAYKSSPEQDTRHNQLLALEELSSTDADFGKGHSLLSDSGALKAHETRLSVSPFYRVTLHAQVAIPTSGEISPVRFRVKRKGVGRASDIRIVFQYEGAPSRPITTSVLYTSRSGEALTPEETAPPQSQKTQPVPWIIRDSRRVALGEVQYLAHPNFGMLFVLADKR